MKFGIRKPNYKARFKARTTGKLKRKIKKAVNPFYGKKGVGFIKNPSKSIKSSIYHRTTVGVPSVLPKSKSHKTSSARKSPSPKPARVTQVRASQNSQAVPVYSAKTYKTTGTVLYIVGIIALLIGLVTAAVGGAFFIILGIVCIVIGRRYKKQAPDTNNIPPRS